MSDTFRLHIDVPLGEDLEEAVMKARHFIECLGKDTVAGYCECDPPCNLKGMEWTFKDFGCIEYGFRVGRDSDRQKKNYLKIDENGHCANGKSHKKLS